MENLTCLLQAKNRRFPLEFLLMLLVSLNVRVIDLFRVALNLIMKARLSAKFLLIEN